MDLYHMKVSEGDLATKLRKYATHCGHVQIAGAPERHEPDTGEVGYITHNKVSDSLTGLPNRVFFTERLTNAFERRRRERGFLQTRFSGF